MGCSSGAVASAACVYVRVCELGRRKRSQATSDPAKRTKKKKKRKDVVVKLVVLLI